MNTTTYVFFGFGLLRIDEIEEKGPFRPLIQFAICQQFRPMDGRFTGTIPFFR